jgi:hypothetical protein
VQIPEDRIKFDSILVNVDPDAIFQAKAGNVGSGPNPVVQQILREVWYTVSDPARFQWMVQKDPIDAFAFA